MSHKTAGSGLPGWHSIAALGVPSRHRLICVSAPMRDLADNLERLAPYRCPVLIAGESGSGKESVAEALHLLGPRRDGPLIKFNCASLAGAETAIQLFGAVERVFGGASAFTPGCFQYADGGSLLLDDIHELPLFLQGKLLHAVENPEVQPVGSINTVSLDVHVIAATNRDLAAMVKAGSFRPDLYYRLLGASLRVPPLRERKADLEPLAAELVARYNRTFDKRVNAISSAALALIVAYSWPGNLREMAHALERAMLMCNDDRIDACDLPATVTDSNTEVPKQRSKMHGDHCDRMISPPNARHGVSTTAGILDAALKDAVERSLEAAGGDCNWAAAMLGVSRATLYHKMVRFGLTRPSSNHAKGFNADLWQRDLSRIESSESLEPQEPIDSAPMSTSDALH